jgi:glycosyltransferase involved in cell wall biosynthesis
VPAEITVVCSTFRRASRLPGLFACLEAQDLERERFEVVIVDNGSHDDTGDVLQRLAAASPLKVRVLRIDVNHGPAAARNLGWRSTSTPFVAFTDDDCQAQPGWIRAGLASLEADPALGVVQGHTEAGSGPIGDWTLQRIVRAPGTPFFEGCNIFYRREALEATGGFDETLGWYGEDTWLGWAVLEKGWKRGFADDALVIHPLEERPMRWHVQSAWLEGNLAKVAARYPDFASEAFWRPWALREYDPRVVMAMAGVAAALAWRRPWPLVLAYPWYRVRREPGHHRKLALLAERAVVDVASVVGIFTSSVRRGRLVI